MSSTSSTLADAWLRIWSPTINLPGSGSIGGFNYHPYTTWEAPSLLRGNQAVEDVVYRNVASPGRQLGKLIDVVIELADAMGRIDANVAESESVKKLKVIAQDINSIKSLIEDNTARAAKELLDKLRSTDPESFNALMTEYGQLSDKR